MISNDEVKNLASLARVALTPEEETKLAGELGQILDYVGELKNAGGESEKKDILGENYNKLREDGEVEASLSDEEREKLLGGKFLKVKKIL
ncbi:MAG: Asp-tRNA(Asn)/Glu-tRNA(Gln) amidotransferase subunit GatC [Patescibacteria group bacterium]